MAKTRKYVYNSLIYCLYFLINCLYFFIIEELSLCVNKLPSDSVGYDWTHKMGANLHDNRDCETESMDFEQDEKSNFNDEELPNDRLIKYNDLPGKNIRLKPSKIDTQWLLITNDKDFIIDIVLTPGIHEEHEFVVPVLANAVESILRNNIYSKQKHLILRCDGMEKNKYCPHYALQLLQKKYKDKPIRSIDNTYQYTFNELYKIVQPACCGWHRQRRIFQNNAMSIHRLRSRKKNKLSLCKESSIAYNDRIEISKQCDMKHMIEYNVEHDKLLSVFSYLSKYKTIYLDLLPSIQKFVKIQSIKKLTTIQSLTAISNHSIFVCTFINNLI